LIVIISRQLPPFDRIIPIMRGRNQPNFQEEPGMQDRAQPHRTGTGTGFCQNYHGLAGQPEPARRDFAGNRVSSGLPKQGGSQQRVDLDRLGYVVQQHLLLRGMGKRRVAGAKANGRDVGLAHTIDSI
jgi:hypothetical protein